MKKTGLFALILGLCAASTAFAAGGIECSWDVDQKSRRVCVNISIDGDNGKTAATGVVLNADNEIVYAAQGFTDENGAFGFEYINNDENGSYTVNVGAPRIDLYTSQTFKMLTGAMVSDIAAKTKTADNVKAVIDDYGEYMNLDTAAFDALADKDAVYAFMAGDSLLKLNDIDSISDCFYGAVIIQSIKENKAHSNYKAFLDDPVYSILDKSGIPAGASLSMLDEASDTVKNGIYDKVISYNYTSAAELSEVLEFYVLEQTLEKAAQWTEVLPALQKYCNAGLITIDFTQYNNLRNKQAADAALMGKPFSSYDDIAAAFSLAVSAAAGAAVSPSISPTKGGGVGGAVLPSIKTPAPVDSVPDTNSGDFSDMEDYRWAYEAVKYLTEKNIISGMGDGTFAPQKGLTREEISTIMVRTQKLDIENKTSAFADVPAEKWSYPYVSAVYNAGLMVGVSEDSFGASSMITRNEFAAIMKRLVDMYDAELTEVIDPEKYDDYESIPEWARESVMYLKSTGLMLGQTGNVFAGNETVNRAYACEVLYTVLTAVGYGEEE